MKLIHVWSIVGGSFHQSLLGFTDFTALSKETCFFKTESCLVARHM